MTLTRFHQTFFLLCLIISIPSCKEIGPNINLGKSSKALSDTTYVEFPVQAAEAKRVMLEEFTGVQCVNCPAGHVIIQMLKNNFSERLVAVAYHTDFLGTPYPFSNSDLRTTAASEIQEYLLFDGYKPAAAIDRFPFDGSQTSLLYPRNSWNNLVQQQLAKTAPLNIQITPVVDEITRKLTLLVELHYTEEVSDPQKLSVLLTESNIIEPQLNAGNVIDTFYIHNDVHRTFLTNSKGDEIKTTTEPGRVVRRIYETQLNADWRIEKMRAIAFVHHFTSKREVLQAAEVELK